MSPISVSPPIDNFNLIKQDERADRTIQASEHIEEQVSAADYDPALDRLEDEEKRVRAVVNKDESTRDADITEVEESEDDVDDMFALVTTEKKKTKKVKISVCSLSVFIVNIQRTHFHLLQNQRPAAPALITTTLDSAADPEGYYQIILGEQLDGGRYQVFSSLGKGMFANVVRARILQGDAAEIGKEVAIKIIRAQESMWACNTDGLSMEVLMIVCIAGTKLV